VSEVQGQGSSLATAQPTEGTPSAAGDRSRRERAAEVHRRLLALYGHRHIPVRRPDPLDELVATILSQHTSDANSARAFAGLRRAFPEWSAVRAAQLDDVEAAIRCGGLARTKARCIRGLLDTLAENGGLSLDCLRDLDTPAARRSLISIPGVGPKTAACVLLFALGRPVMPVDTHVHRVARRLGLAARDASPDAVESALESLIEPDWCLDMHVNLIAHGRRVCLARQPRCGECALADLCDQARAEAIPASP
jgi:endonuclease III